MPGEYGQGLKVGMRVELSPACDLWMRGAKYATVTDIQDEWVLVRMENKRVRKIQIFKSEYLRCV